MDDARRERMRLRQFIQYIELYKLPSEDIEFFESEWQLWIDRISNSEESETDNIKSWIKDHEDVEWLAEDVGKIDETSWNMYASLIVSIWSKIDHYLKLSCKYIVLKENTRFSGRDFIKYGEFINSYKNDPAFFSSIINNKTLNFIRVLNNSFKHSNGRYIKPPISKYWDVLDTNLAIKYGIAKIVSGNNILEEKIPYEDLKFQELIIDAGVFCNKLISDIR